MLQRSCEHAAEAINLSEQRKCGDHCVNPQMPQPAAANALSDCRALAL
jgi:hypothetical protein